MPTPPQTWLRPLATAPEDGLDQEYGKDPSDDERGDWTDQRQPHSSRRDETSSCEPGSKSRPMDRGRRAPVGETCHKRLLRLSRGLKFLALIE